MRIENGGFRMTEFWDMVWVSGFFGLQVLRKEDNLSLIGKVVRVDARQVNISLPLFDNSIVDNVEIGTVRFRDSKIDVRPSELERCRELERG